MIFRPTPESCRRLLPRPTQEKRKSSKKAKIQVWQSAPLRAVQHRCCSDEMAKIDCTTRVRQRDAVPSPACCSGSRQKSPFFPKHRPLPSKQKPAWQLILQHGLSFLSRPRLPDDERFSDSDAAGSRGTGAQKPVFSDASDNWLNELVGGSTWQQSVAFQTFFSPFFEPFCLATSASVQGREPYLFGRHQQRIFLFVVRFLSGWCRQSNATVRQSRKMHGSSPCYNSARTSDLSIPARAVIFC